MPTIAELHNIDLSNYRRVLPDKPINAPDEHEQQLVAIIRRIVREELAKLANQI
jgi:hypothetical protein